MTRFLRTNYPDCRLTIVERDATILDIARRRFDVTEPVILADARAFIAQAAARKERYDVIQVDIYDVDGFAGCERAFWRQCFAALSPQGCLAINWSDVDEYARHAHVARFCAAMAETSFSVTPKNGRENLIQFCVRDPGFDLERLGERLHGFETRQRRRTNLGRCRIAAIPPD
jgi:spermidine synthase